MPTFSTPEPITMRARFGSGTIVIDAADGETDVQVRPSNPDRQQDVEHAENTSVDFHHNTLTIRAPETHGGRSPSIAVLVRLPEGSDVDVTVGSADTRANCRLGDVTVTGGSGDVRLSDTGNVLIKLGSGDILAGNVSGRTDITSGSGDVNVREIGDTAKVNTASGDCMIGEAHSALQLNTASGDVRVDRAHRSVEGKTASGDAYIAVAMSEVISWNSASGDVWIGVPAGTAALLDVSSLTGDVSSGLDGADEPTESDQRVEIRARSVSGDIHIARA